MRYGRHIIVLDPKVDPKNDAVAISYPSVNSRLDTQVKNSFQEKSKFYQTTWLWESFTFLSSEKGLKNLQLVADFPREHVFKNMRHVKTYTKLWKHLEKTQKRKALAEKALISSMTKNHFENSSRNSIGFGLWSKHLTLLRKVYLANHSNNSSHSPLLSTTINSWNFEKNSLSWKEKSELLTITTSILLLSSNRSDNSYGKLWWKIKQNSSKDVTSLSSNSFPNLLDQPNSIFLDISSKLRELSFEINKESETGKTNVKELLPLTSAKDNYIEANLVSPLGSKMSSTDYTQMNKEILSNLINKYSKMSKTFEEGSNKSQILSLLRDRLSELKETSKTSNIRYNQSYLLEETTLLQNLIDNYLMFKEDNPTYLSKTSMLVEEVWSTYWDLMCENLDSEDKNSGGNIEIRLIHWLLLQSFVTEWDSNSANSETLTKSDDTLFRELSSELNTILLSLYSSRSTNHLTPLLGSSSDSTEVIARQIIDNLASQISQKSLNTENSSSSRSTYYSSDEKFHSSQSKSNQKFRDNMTVEEKLRADAQEKAFKVDEVKHNRYDLNFLRKEFMFTKLKYSRCPAYDSVSGGFAALFAGFIGFLISEKFGIELVDSGDFYVGLMYILFTSFIVRLLIFSTADSVDETPSFILSFYPIKLFYKELMLTAVKRIKSLFFN